MPSMITAPPDRDRIVFGWGRRRTIMQVGCFALFAFLCGRIALDPRLNPGLNVIGAGLTILFAGAIVAVLLRLVGGRPAMICDEIGFEVPHLAAGRVAWNDIRDMSTMESARLSKLFVAVDRRAAATLEFSAAQRIRFALRLARPTRMVLSLSMFDRPSREIVALFERHRRRAGYVPPIVPKRDRDAAVALARPPRFAYALALLLVVLLALEYRFALEPVRRFGSLDIRTLWGLGATQSVAIFRDGEWWRLVTATLLHSSVAHLVCNGIALWFAARLLEPLIGWRWFAAAFAVSAVAGSFCSVLVNPAGMVGVGASGGILGLSAATAVVALRFEGDVRTRLLTGAFQILLPSLLPSLHQGAAPSAQGGSEIIDFAGHIGGAIGGLLMGSMIVALWVDDTRMPRGGMAAAAIAGLYFAVAAASIAPVAASYRKVQAVAALDPTFPRDFNVAITRAAQLLTAYPRDPRVRAAHAEMLVKQDDIPGAEKDLEGALADKPMLAAGVTTSEPYLRVRLAQLLVSEEKTDEATKVLQPACATTVASLKAAIQQMALCR